MKAKPEFRVGDRSRTGDTNRANLSAWRSPPAALALSTQWGPPNYVLVSFLSLRYRPAMPRNLRSLSCLMIATRGSWRSMPDGLVGGDFRDAFRSWRPLQSEVIEGIHPARQTVGYPRPIRLSTEPAIPAIRSYF